MSPITLRNMKRSFCHRVQLCRLHDASQFEHRLRERYLGTNWGRWHLHCTCFMSSLTEDVKVYFLSKLWSTLMNKRFICNKFPLFLYYAITTNNKVFLWDWTFESTCIYITDELPGYKNHRVSSLLRPPIFKMYAYFRLSFVSDVIHHS